MRRRRRGAKGVHGTPPTSCYYILGYILYYYYYIVFFVLFGRFLGARILRSGGTYFTNRARHNRIISCSSKWKRGWRTEQIETDSTDRCLVLVSNLQILTAYIATCMCAVRVWRFETSLVPPTDGEVGWTGKSCRRELRHKDNMTTPFPHLRIYLW